MPIAVMVVVADILVFCFTRKSTVNVSVSLARRFSDCLVGFQELPCSSRPVRLKKLVVSDIVTLLIAEGPFPLFERTNIKCTIESETAGQLIVTVLSLPNDK